MLPPIPDDLPPHINAYIDSLIEHREKDPRAVVSKKEAGEIIGYRDTKIGELIKAGEIRALVFGGGRVMIDRTSLLEWQIREALEARTSGFAGRRATTEQQRIAAERRKATKEPIPPKVKRPRGRPRKYASALETKRPEPLQQEPAE
jgi:hypothetical protein